MDALRDAAFVSSEQFIQTLASAFLDHSGQMEKKNYKVNCSTSTTQTEIGL